MCQNSPGKPFGPELFVVCGEYFKLFIQLLYLLGAYSDFPFLFEQVLITCSHLPGLNLQNATLCCAAALSLLSFINIFYFYILVQLPRHASGLLACSVMSDSLGRHGPQSSRLLCPWNFPGKTTGVGCNFLLREIFPTQGLNPHLQHCRQILYLLSHQRRWLPRTCHYFYRAKWSARLRQFSKFCHGFCFPLGTLRPPCGWSSLPARQDCVESLLRPLQSLISRMSLLNFWLILWLWLISHECLVTQSCLTLCDPMDCSPPGSSVQRILQARVRGCGAIAFSRGSSRLRNQTCVSHVSCTGRGIQLGELQIHIRQLAQALPSSLNQISPLWQRSCQFS